MQTRLPVLPSTRAVVAVEVADPAVVSSDFSFRRASIQLERRQRTSGRAAMLTMRHDFGRLPFLATGIPLVRAIPLTLSVHGGVFDGFVVRVGLTP